VRISEEQDGCDSLIPELPMYLGGDSRSDRLGLVANVNRGNAIEREDTGELHLFPSSYEHMLVGKELRAAQEVFARVVVTETWRRFR
jgi:hypothetical protein